MVAKSQRQRRDGIHGLHRSSRYHDVATSDITVACSMYPAIRIDYAVLWSRAHPARTLVMTRKRHFCLMNVSRAYAL